MSFAARCDKNMFLWVTFIKKISLFYFMSYFFDRQDKNQKQTIISLQIAIFGSF